MDQYRQSGACRGVVEVEVEAESIAFLVAASSGLDSSDYTVPYVAGWAGGDVELLKGTPSRVLTVSRGIVDDAGLGVEGQRALAAPAIRPQRSPKPVEIGQVRSER